MKTFKRIFILLLVSIIFSCTNDQNLIETQTVELKFENRTLNSKSKDQSNFINYSLTINYLGEIQLNNDTLSLVEAINEETGQKSFVVVQKNESSDKKGGTNHLKGKTGVPEEDENNNPHWETGYFFDGECFVYGTMFYGGNGVNLFNPCGINCIGFDDVCPKWNEAFA